MVWLRASSVRREGLHLLDDAHKSAEDWLTAHPTGAWVAQRMVEAGGDARPRYLLCDRDSIYDARLRARLRGLGVRCLLSPPRAPNGERDLRAPGGHAPARLPRSRPRPQRAPRRAHPARICPLLPRTTASQPAHPPAHGRALARSGTSRHIP